MAGQDSPGTTTDSLELTIASQDSTGIHKIYQGYERFTKTKHDLLGFTRAY